METPEPPLTAPCAGDARRDPPTPARRRFSRRTLFKLAGGAVAVGFAAEAVRVLALTNVHTVIPGRVYRTAQLDPEELRAFIAGRGIRTVINLRGMGSTTAWYLDECRAAHAANVSHEDVTLSAKRFPAPGEVARLLEVFDRSASPVVMHCKQGADRTGFAATVARLLYTDDTLAQARRQLWPRYGHFAVGRLAELDAVFDYYERSLAIRGVRHTQERFRRWVAHEYCPGPFRANLSVVGPTSVPTGRGCTVVVRAENTSVEPWEFTSGGAGGVRLTHTLATAAGVVVRRATAGEFARTVRPGESVELACGLPPLPAGAVSFHADLTVCQPIELLNTNFAQYGSEPLQVPLTVG